MEEKKSWSNQYQLFLLDFDGLLVNTEELHYLAYKKMCAKNGVDLTWDFATYCSMAHISSHAIRDELYKQFPQLMKKQPIWETLYLEKKRLFIEFLQEGKVPLMPGVEEFLLALQSANVKRCVVTHSSIELISPIRKQNPILDTIPNWITREDYTHPKPHSECYLRAIERFAEPNDRIIGFEDTPRGITALLPTRAKPVMISSLHYPETPNLLEKGASLYSSFHEFMVT